MLEFKWVASSYLSRMTEVNGTEQPTSVPAKSSLALMEKTHSS